jgi:hypothetical protein
LHLDANEREKFHEIPAKILHGLFWKPSVRAPFWGAFERDVGKQAAGGRIGMWFHRVGVLDRYFQARR